MTNMVDLLIDGDGTTPKYQTKGDAGADVYANITSPVIMNPLDRVLIPSGVKLDIPLGYEVQVRSRSGLSLKHGIIVLNSPGTVDAPFKKEIGIILINLSNTPFTVNPQDRIAQLVLNKVEQMNFIRGVIFEGDRGGFGSTGI